MKKIVYISITILIVLSCSTNKVIKESRKSLKGYWNLNTVSYSESGIYNVTLFNDVSSECIAGSTWRFIPNNNFGNYEITASDCNSGVRYFVWDIQDSSGDASNYDILLKPTDAKMKSIMNNKGFRIRVSYLSDTELTMSQTVQSDGKPFTITMNFSKNSN